MGSHPFFSRNITSEVSVLCSCAGASFRKLIARRSCTPLRRTCSTSTRASTQFLTCAPPSSRHGMAWQLFDIAECVWLRRCSVWLLSLHLAFLRRVYQGSPSLQPSATSTVSTRLETWCWSPRFCRTTPDSSHRTWMKWILFKIKVVPFFFRDMIQPKVLESFATPIECVERRCKTTPASRSRHLPARTSRGAALCALKHGSAALSCMYMCQYLWGLWTLCSTVALDPRSTTLQRCHAQGIGSLQGRMSNKIVLVWSLCACFWVWRLQHECMLQALNAGVVKMNVDTDTWGP